MTRVFADTFYFLALLNPRDPAHEDALVFYGDTSLHFTTTEWVLRLKWAMQPLFLTPGPASGN